MAVREESVEEGWIETGPEPSWNEGRCCDDDADDDDEDEVVEEAVVVAAASSRTATFG